MRGDKVMIHINKLQKVYDNGYEALKSINLEINEGELVCLLGPSGCGKTTILNLLAGLLDPTSGDIKFDNESVINKHPKDRNIGLVFQNYALYPHMTVLENVMFPLTVGKKKKPKEEAEKIAEKACACIKGNVYHRSDVGTTDLVNKRVEHMKEILN